MKMKISSFIITILLVITATTGCNGKNKNEKVGITQEDEDKVKVSAREVLKKFMNAYWNLNRKDMDLYTDGKSSFILDSFKLEKFDEYDSDEMLKFFNRNMKLKIKSTEVVKDEVIFDVDIKYPDFKKVSEEALQKIKDSDDFETVVKKYNEIFKNKNNIIEKSIKVVLIKKGDSLIIPVDTEKNGDFLNALKGNLK